MRARTARISSFENADQQLRMSSRPFVSIATTSGSRRPFATRPILRRAHDDSRAEIPCFRGIPQARTCSLPPNGKPRAGPTLSCHRRAGIIAAEKLFLNENNPRLRARFHRIFSMDTAAAHRDAMHATPGMSHARIRLQGHKYTRKYKWKYTCSRNLPALHAHRPFIADRSRTAGNARTCRRVDAPCPPADMASRCTMAPRMGSRPAPDRTQPLPRGATDAQRKTPPERGFPCRGTAATIRTCTGPKRRTGSRRC